MRRTSALGSQIEGVDCAITMRELRPDVWKMSCGPVLWIMPRACRLLGGGGCHATHAGCTVEAPGLRPGANPGCRGAGGADHQR